ncbi:cytochrome d ubiquinol oxidase subunit II [Nitrospirillum sp. BR 11752]|uniref:cytochrome d ubiquinol oxidase subunit II n=1 Tax=Nitrospirillum sp. BR 11752 TaxID=3104293 RepID=UPI002ECF6147|nr:cytochrome d ubiquinol oxidase subunit II [Nitrospirillum sp. BR 11752]
MLDYETLRLLWWALLGVLLIGFAIMDGFDLGVAALLPILGRTDLDRRVMINTVGPVWEGNQVWLILGGGAVFAAWPALYATAFSGFYIAMFLVLCALILRPVGFKFRSKLDGTAWRRAWDTALVVGGVVPAVVFGVAFGNVLQGVPFHFDTDLRVTYTGGFFDLLNPFALLCGFVSLAMVVMHGAVYLAVKTDGEIAARARGVVPWAVILLLALFSLAGAWIAAGIDGYAITSALAPDGPSNPLMKSVARAPGAWLENYHRFPISVAVPALGYAGALATWGLVRAGRAGLAFITSSLAVAGVVGTVGVSVFPFLLPSVSDPASSLTVWDASSSPTTLRIMLVAALIFMPLILAYTAWVFRVLRGPVRARDITTDGGAFY